jgi:hypothetical protein
MGVAGTVRQPQPPRSPKALLYSQLANPTGGNHTSQEFSDFPAFTNRAAEDFVVGLFGWTVGQIFVAGSNSGGAAPTTIVDVTFLTNSGGLPGVPVAGCDYPNLTTVTDTAGDLTITLSPPCVLPAGTFWVSVRADKPFGTSGQWYWDEQSVAAGSPYAWENPGNGFGTGCTAWSAGGTCLGSGAIESGFALYGSPNNAPVPELLYYKFNEPAGTTTVNYAIPGVGAATATVNGHTLGGVGQFGGGVVGIGGSSSTNFVDTGWVTALGTGSWTLGFWLDNRTTNPGAILQYLCCDNTAASFRIFSNGVAGAENLILRGPLTDVLITGGASYSSVTSVAWVYDSTVPEIRAYLNGVLANTVAQPALDINGSGANFKVVGYDSSGTLLPNGVMDEFRLYSRALSAAEIAATWNVDLYDLIFKDGF